MQTIYKKYDKTLNEELKNVCAVEIEKHGRIYCAKILNLKAARSNGLIWNGIFNFCLKVALPNGRSATLERVKNYFETNAESLFAEFAPALAEGKAGNLERLRTFKANFETAILNG
jgi:hypothetical protein